MLRPQSANPPSARRFTLPRDCPGAALSLPRRRRGRGQAHASSQLVNTASPAKWAAPRERRVPSPRRGDGCGQMGAKRRPEQVPGECDCFSDDDSLRGHLRDVRAEGLARSGTLEGGAGAAVAGPCEGGELGHRGAAAMASRDAPAGDRLLDRKPTAASGTARIPPQGCRRLGKRTPARYRVTPRTRSHPRAAPAVP